MIHIFYHHKGYFESDGILKGPEIQASGLLKLIQPVDQGVAVDEKLS